MRGAETGGTGGWGWIKGAETEGCGLIRGAETGTGSGKGIGETGL